ncbi:MAG: hypothetical protein COA36_17370 [Desulfotalea sp.]|nr:MAG: hypothetical protein COA36_17370 [Desulfotalea sp.]
MTETLLHPDTQTHSPFQEEIVLDNYYATKNSQQILRSIKEAVVEGVAMVVLSGDEGSGKTMLCHKLDLDLKFHCNTLFFPRTVDSFEDVVRIIAIGHGLDPQIGGGTRNVEAVVDEITAALIIADQPLLLIFDEAENIYLATLERIRKMLDRVRGAGGRIHVLFSGRKTFLENSEQLSMCDFQNTEEYHVCIEPLSEDETLAYLVDCCSQLPEIDGNVIFTPEVVHSLFQVAGGNFRMTNILAEEAIQKDGDDTSFMVLLGNVKEDVTAGGDGVGLVRLLKDYLKKYRVYLPYGVGAVGVVGICFVFLLSMNNGTTELDSEVIVVEKTDQSIATQIPAKKLVEPEVVINEIKVEPLVQVEPREQGGIVSLASGDEPQMPQVEIDFRQQLKFSPPVEEKSLVVKEVLEPVVVSLPPEPAVVPTVFRQEKKRVEIVELLRTTRIKKRPGKLPKTTMVTIKEEVRKEKRRNEVREVIAANAHFTVEQLYKKRLMAGTPWYNNKKNHKYTVQVMVLTSKTAETNLKRMLQESRYRQEAGNFYIFKKLSTPDTLFVFYGEYPTISLARLAQNSLPQFLRNHKPYAISIKGAMAKVRR